MRNKSKIKITPGETLEITSKIMKDFKSALESQNKKIDLLKKEIEQNQSIQNNIEGVKNNLKKENNYIFVIKIMTDLTQWNKLYGNEVNSKQKLAELRSKIEVLMNEYRVQEMSASFLKKFNS